MIVWLKVVYTRKGLGGVADGEVAKKYLKMTKLTISKKISQD